jgi:hypothetical protein
VTRMGLFADGLARAQIGELSDTSVESCERSSRLPHGLRERMENKSVSPRPRRFVSLRIRATGPMCLGRL